MRNFTKQRHKPILSTCNGVLLSSMTTIICMWSLNIAWEHQVSWTITCHWPVLQPENVFWNMTSVTLKVIADLPRKNVRTWRRPIVQRTYILLHIVTTYDRYSNMIPRVWMRMLEFLPTSYTSAVSQLAVNISAHFSAVSKGCSFSDLGDQLKNATFLRRQPKKFWLILSYQFSPRPDPGFVIQRILSGIKKVTFSDLIWLKVYSWWM